MICSLKFCFEKTAGFLFYNISSQNCSRLIYCNAFQRCRAFFGEYSCGLVQIAAGSLADRCSHQCNSGQCKYDKNRCAAGQYFFHLYSAFQLKNLFFKFEIVSQFKISAVHFMVIYQFKFTLPAFQVPHFNTDFNPDNDRFRARFKHSFLPEFIG